MHQMEKVEKLKDGSYIEVFYINHARAREIAEEIIRSYLPDTEPTKEEKIGCFYYYDKFKYFESLIIIE